MIWALSKPPKCSPNPYQSARPNVGQIVRMTARAAKHPWWLNRLWRIPLHPWKMRPQRPTVAHAARVARANQNLTPGLTRRNDQA
jgi:hypothetical protein